MDLNKLMSLDKDELPKAAGNIAVDDLPRLVELLSEKDDVIRYQVFQLLQIRSSQTKDVYPFWDVFRKKLASDNSYQRSIGLMLIAGNAVWDTENRMDAAMEEYLKLLNDEKPITVRQCIQSLNKIIPYKPHLSEQIAKSLMSINLEAVKETMRKLLLIDVLNILCLIRKSHTSNEIETYIANAMMGEILDKKAKKQVEAALRQ